MPPRSLIDTDILSEYLKGHDANVVAFGNSYAQAYGVFTFTSVTVFEVLFGLEFKNASSQLAKVQAWFSQNEEITPIASDYRTAAAVKAAAARSGSTVELPDCLIAAVAVRLNRPLVTGNTADFQAIRAAGLNLTIQNWRAGSP
jgi:predicted nucleic acid-binding protein